MADMKRIWVRVGGYIYGTEEELDALVKKNEGYGGLTEKDIADHPFKVDGESYIPDESEIEDID